MKNVAILVVQYDTISKRYETEMTYLSDVETEDKEDELYISSSPHVNLEFIRYGVGTEKIKKLEEIQRNYNNKNLDNII